MQDPRFDSSSSSNDDGLAGQMLAPMPSYSWHHPQWQPNPTANQYDEISTLSPDGSFNNINTFLDYNVDESSAILALKVIQEHQNRGQFSTETVEAAKMILQHHMMVVNGGLIAHEIPNAAESTTLVPTTASGLMHPHSGASISKDTVSINEVSDEPKQRVRARRGQATDPHSVAERLRRERIAERTKALQDLVPNANKTDRASMLNEIIDYVKFLQLQIKVLGDQTLPSGEDEIVGHNVAKLMEEDMRSAMEYLQANGVCVMPIKLITDVSSATCNKLGKINDDDEVDNDDDDDGPSCLSPCMSLSSIRPPLLGGTGSGGSDAPSASCLL